MEQSLEGGLDCGRKNVPVKKTKFSHSHVVEYFTAAKALDALLNDSPWAKAGRQQYTLMFDNLFVFFYQMLHSGTTVHTSVSDPYSFDPDQAF
jgi:hypothetical protein